MAGTPRWAVWVGACCVPLVAACGTKPSPLLGSDAAVPVADGGASPDAGKVDAGASGSPLGASCGAAGACAGGICLSQDETGFPGGYCSAPCSATPCPSGGICYATFSVCLQPCDLTVGCRAGYTCATAWAGQALPSPACVPGNETARTGDACTSLGDCRVGGFCALERDSGFPGGYCSQGCRLGTSDCGADGTCADIDGSGPAAPFCLDACTADGECRTGYVCEPTWFGQTLDRKVCVPGTRTPVAVGAACANSGDCPASWFCVGETDGFFGGYCTRACAGDTDCGMGAFCLSGVNICLTSCAQASDCREKYDCHDVISGLQLVQTTCVPFTEGAQVGSPCTGAGHCPLGGNCLPEVDGQGQATGFEGGYCTAPCTAMPDSCADGAYCLVTMNGNLCVDRCVAESECRDGYACLGTAGQQACLPGGGT